MINIKILFFASLASACETSESTLQLPLNTTVADALDQIALKHHAFHSFRNDVATAINMEYVPKTHPLSDNDELALIPPVSGG